MDAFGFDSMNTDAKPSSESVDPSADQSPLVCHCMMVEEDKIRAAIEAGAHTIEAVQDETYASTGCGTCRYEVQALLREAGHETPDDPGR